MTINGILIQEAKLLKMGNKLLNGSMRRIAYNGFGLGEVGDFENETLKLLLNLN